MPYNGSRSADVEEELVYIVEKLESLKLSASKAKSQAELDAKIAEMHLTIARGMRTGHNWAKEDLKDIFNAGYRQFHTGTKPKSDVDAAYRLRKKSRESMVRLERELNGWTDQQGRAILAGKQLAAIEAAMKTAKGPEFVKLRQQATAVRKTLGTSTPIPMVTYFSRRGKRVAVAEMPAPTYIRTVTHAGHVDNENQGIIRGAIAGGVEYLLVRDGEECGWASHDSRPLADGMEVTVKEALAHPKAHPNCERYFMLPSGAERKEAKERAKARAAAAKAAKAAAKAKKAAERKQKAAAAARTAVTVAKVGVRVYQSQTARLLINNILDESYRLPEPLRQFAQKFHKFQVQEQIVSTTATMTEGAQVSTNEVRDRVLQWGDEIIGEPDQIHNVPGPMQRILGLPAKATTKQIQDKIWSYGDYVAKQKSAAASAADNAVDSSIWAAAREEHHATAPMAQYFHMSEPRGYDAGEATKAVASVLYTAFTKDPDKLAQAVIYDLATNIDPLPWLRVPVDPWHFSIRMSTEGRRNLALKLYGFARDEIRFSAADKALAKEAGVKLAEAPDLKDVYRALLPRVTVNPGGVVSFTVSIENGVVKPVLRVLPQWAATKYFSYEVTLAGGAIGRIKAAIDEGQDVATILRGLPDELISTISVFRNGPFTANLNFWGARWNGYSIFAQGDQEWIRFINRFRRYVRVPYASMAKDELVTFGHDHGVILDPDMNRSEMIGILRDRLGDILPLNQQWTEVSVLPGGFAGASVTMDNEFISLVGRLHSWSGSLVHVSREMRWDYETLKQIVAEAKTKLNYQYQKLKPAELARIRSWEDLKRYVASFKDTTLSRAEDVTPSPTPPGMHNVSPLLENAASPALRQDIETFNHSWDQTHPHAPRPNFDIVRVEDQRSEIEFRDGTIFIREDAARNWAALRRIAARNESVGFSPKGTGTTQGLIWHEAGHDLFTRLGFQGMDQLRTDIVNSPDVPKYLRERFLLESNQPEIYSRQNLVQIFQRIFFGSPGKPTQVDRSIKTWIRNNVSGYATKNINELMGDAFSEYMTSKHPRPFAELVGRILSQYGGLGRG